MKEKILIKYYQEYYEINFLNHNIKQDCIDFLNILSSSQEDERNHVLDKKSFLKNFVHTLYFCEPRLTKIYAMKINQNIHLVIVKENFYNPDSGVRFYACFNTKIWNDYIKNYITEKSNWSFEGF